MRASLASIYDVIILYEITECGLKQKVTLLHNPFYIQAVTPEQQSVCKRGFIILPDNDIFSAHPQTLPPSFPHPHTTSLLQQNNYKNNKITVYQFPVHCYYKYIKTQDN